MKKIFQNGWWTRRPVQLTMTLLAGLLAGWVLFHDHGRSQKQAAKVAEAEPAKSIWTCSMDPQVKQDHPGLCPICGMDLIPLVSGGGDSMAVHLTPEALRLAEVSTVVVRPGSAAQDLRLYGQVKVDDGRIRSLTADVPGRIEQLYVTFVGAAVRKGQALALIRSPELNAAQADLLEAARHRRDEPEVYEAARSRMRQWKLTDEQLDRIVSSGQVQQRFVLLAGSSGIVTAKRVNPGDYVATGSSLMDVADLSRVWVDFQAYAADLPSLQVGDGVDFTVEALPGKRFSSRISFVGPVMDGDRRVVVVRAEVANPGGRLKPEMFANGVVHARPAAQGTTLVIPSSAVLWTGKRSVVYVRLPGDEPQFRLREIELGPALSNGYVVLSGLTEGEEIVAEGAFSIDAAAQLEGKPNMMQ